MIQLIPRSEYRWLSRPLCHAIHSPVPCHLRPELSSLMPYPVSGSSVAQSSRLPVQVMVQDTIVGGHYGAVHVARTGVEAPRSVSRAHQIPPPRCRTGDGIYLPSYPRPLHPPPAAPPPSPTKIGGVAPEPPIQPSCTPPIGSTPRCFWQWCACADGCRTPQARAAPRPLHQWI